MSGSTLPNIGIAYVDADCDRALAFIRARHPVKTAECVAAETGVPASTVRRWLEHVARPSWSGFARLIFSYGAAFLVAVYPRAPKWIDEAYQQERLAALEAEHARIAAELAALKR